MRALKCARIERLSKCFRSYACTTMIVLSGDCRTLTLLMLQIRRSVLRNAFVGWVDMSDVGAPSIFLRWSKQRGLLQIVRWLWLTSLALALTWGTAGRYFHPLTFVANPNPIDSCQAEVSFPPGVVCCLRTCRPTFYIYCLIKDGLRQNAKLIALVSIWWNAL